MKRVLDLVAALVGLMVLAPLLAAIAVAIKLDSSGPVLFRQVRVGRRGVPFAILKFRTLATIQPGQATAIGDDGRVTRLGRVLRRWKLDELPQLVNVLLGEMSLVGPRPELPVYVARYSARDRDIVLSVRPGITDLASIRFRNESDWLAQARDPERVYVEEILPRKLRLCRFYVRHRSLRLDLRLIATTLYAMLGGRVAEARLGARAPVATADRAATSRAAAAPPSGSSIPV